MLLLLLFILIQLSSQQNILDNGLLGDPEVECHEDKLRLKFKTEKPFTGRIFVKGMIEDKECVSNYAKNKNTTIDYQILNGHCNMRRSRKLGPETRGIEQSTIVIVSFHDTFITKIDRAYHCACLYKEFDKIVTNRFDVSMFPTTEIFDSARVPTCTYSVHRGSVNGPVINFATVGEDAYHVWKCESDMFAMLVHDCFVDDGNGKEKINLIDENGCSIDPAIVSDLTYNSQANMAYSQVSVFKFADKVSTYFQCAVSTCMLSEGMCKGKTPPRCGASTRRRRTIYQDNNQTTTLPTKIKKWADEMDLSAEKIIVLDLEDLAPKKESPTPNKVIIPSQQQQLALRQLNEIQDYANGRLCFTKEVITIFTCILAFTFLSSIGIMATFLWKAWVKSKL